jgi:regulator of replication initiation timing
MGLSEEPTDKALTAATDLSTVEAVREPQGEAAAEPAKAAQPSAHQAAVAANKARARQDREWRTKERQEAVEARKTARGNLGERYHKAAQEVGRLRREFLAALDEKAALLQVQRVGEAVPSTSPELQSLNSEIKATRQKLDELLTRKRELKLSTPGLKEVTARINRLRREREEWRKEKKAAYAEAMAAKEPTSDSQVAS